MKRLVIGGAVALVVVIGISVVLFGRSHKTEPKTHALTVTSEAAISVDGSPAGATLSPSTYGLSLEATELARPQFGGGNVAKYMRSLGAGVLRIGGSRVDDTFWTSTNENAPDWSTGTITPNDLARLGDLAKASGWKVILGVNLKHADAARAADEAKHAQQALGSSLEAIAIGNEPSLYYSSFTDYKAEFDAYVTAIASTAPDVPIIGADTQHSSASENLSEPFAQSQRQYAQIVQLAEHYYPTTTCGNRRSSIDDLLSSSVYLNDKAAFDQIVRRGKTATVPAILDETNSVSCEGQQGVSDTFASALWAVSYGLEAAHEGLRGVYFHGSLTQCNSARPYFKFYTPLCAATKADADKGNVSGQPLYFGMLALHAAGTGSFLPVSNSSFPNVRAYAIKDAHTMRVVVVNLESSPSYSAKKLSITVPDGYTTASQSTLQTSADPALSAKTHVSFDDSNATMPVVGGKVDVVVPNPGATVVTFR